MANPELELSDLAEQARTESVPILLAALVALPSQCLAVPFVQNAQLRQQLRLVSLDANILRKELAQSSAVRSLPRRQTLGLGSTRKDVCCRCRSWRRRVWRSRMRGLHMIAWARSASAPKRGCTLTGTRRGHSLDERAAETVSDVPNGLRRWRARSRRCRL